jgi:hypothetical protein
MFGKRRLHGYRGLLPGLVSVGVIGAILAVTLDIDLPPTERAAAPSEASALSASSASSVPTASSASSSARCGPASATTIARVDDLVAHRIYAAELGGNEARADIAHITGSAELLAALQSSNPRAVYAAVHRIVYTPLWHIVRLRVLRYGHVLADVGGPDIIAPISGTLRSKGRAVGSFVMSVQDDLGYVKLVSRFIGVPIDLYRAGTFVMGTLKPPPASLSNGETVTVAGRSTYRADVFNTAAFPTGTLQVALLVPTPASGLAARSCASVRLAAWGNIAHHIAARFRPLSAHYHDLLDVLQGISGGLVLVRSGSVRLAGGGPARVPNRGTVKYRGRTWAVLSWEATPPARIYFLTPTTPPSSRRHA